MNPEYTKAYVEVLEILKTLKEEDYKKIPKDTIELYEEYKDKNYKFKLDKTKKIESQIKNETKNVLANLYVKYLASNEERIDIIRKEQLNNN